MYTEYFSLKEKPFSITPDPAYLFLSKRHAEALAHLVYGVTDSGGFIQLTGEVGTGKTTTIRSLLKQLPDNVDIALILNPRLSVNEFLFTICEELHIELNKGASNKECIDALNQYLLDAYAQERRVILLVDEAQNLSVEVLEQIRLLTNLETHKDKLLQIILVGQPELHDLLQRQDLRQLAQRITARYHLDPLDRSESAAYLSHRLSVAGANREVFSSGAKKLIYKASQGIPRLMNVIADRALLGAFSQEKRMVDAKTAKRSIQEVLGQHSVQQYTVLNQKSGFNRLLLGLLAIPLLLGFFYIGYQYLPQLQTDKSIFKTTKTSKDQNDSGALAQSDVNYANNTTVQPVNNDAIQIDDVENDDVLDNLTTQGVGVENSNTLNVDSQAIQNESVVNSTDSVQENVRTLSEWLSVHPDLQSSENAFNRLLNIWGKDKFQLLTDPCDKLLAFGLRCYYVEYLSAGKLLQLNRPLVLEFNIAPYVYFVTLKSITSDGQWVLQSENSQFTVSQEEALKYWTGAGLYFWQPPPESYPLLLKFGSEGSEVQWVNNRLNEIGIEPIVDNGQSTFDSLLLQRVMSFQRINGLDQDGVLGRDSFMMINNWSNTNEVPKLR